MHRVQEKFNGKNKKQKNAVENGKWKTELKLRKKENNTA